MKVALLARDLEVGGAQRQLVTLARGLHRRGVPTCVVSCFAGGALESDLRRDCVPTHVLDKRGRWDVVPFMARLVSVLRRERPDALCSYLVLANILAAVVKPVLPDCRVAWGVRASRVDLDRYDGLARGTARIEAALSRAADVIITNSHSGRRQAELRRFPKDRLVVVPNGVDTSAFRPDPEGGRRVRREWGIDERAPLVGLVARIDPMKDHANFLAAAGRLAVEAPDMRFACVGDGPAALRAGLVAKGAALGLADRLTWSPVRADMPAVYGALSVLVSASSFGEGFPNVVAEAMACGTPCVVTDVGDSALVAGEDSVVVASGDAPALAAGVVRMLARRGDDAALPGRLRERVEREFSVDCLVTRTLAALRPGAGSDPAR